MRFGLLESAYFNSCLGLLQFHILPDSVGKTNYLQTCKAQLDDAEHNRDQRILKNPKQGVV